MTDKEKQLMIAESVGFRWRKRGAGYEILNGINTRGDLIGYQGTGSVGHQDYSNNKNNELILSAICSFLPDYLYDLNAMHEAEKTLKVNQLYQYDLELMIATGDQNNIIPKGRTMATARQRADAFVNLITP